MGISANIELGQQHFAAGLRVIGDLKNCDQFVGNFHRVLKLNLLPWPAAVVANAVGYTPFQRLAGLCTAHDDGVVSFEALAQGLVVVFARVQVERAGGFGGDLHGLVAVFAGAGFVPCLGL